MNRHELNPGILGAAPQLADHLSSRPPATLDLLSRHPVVLTASWSETPSRALELRASHLPFLGEAIVMIATARGSAVVGPSLELGIALPAVHCPSQPRAG